MNTFLSGGWSRGKFSRSWNNNLKIKQHKEREQAHRERVNSNEL